jgi:hypothetical protein
VVRSFQFQPIVTLPIERRASPVLRCVLCCGGGPMARDQDGEDCARRRRAVNQPVGVAPPAPVPGRAGARTRRVNRGRGTSRAVRAR